MDRPNVAIMASNLAYACEMLELSMEQLAGRAHISVDDLKQILAPTRFPELNQAWLRILNALCSYLMISIDIFSQKDMKLDNLWPAESIDYLWNHCF